MSEESRDQKARRGDKETMIVKIPSGKAEAFLEIGLVRTTFSCGCQSNFMAFPVGHPERLELERIANMHGFSSAEEFAVHHELAHHFIASSLNWKHSIVVWTDAHGQRPDLPDEYPYRSQDEEHLSNRLLAFVFLDQPDPYGCLESLLGEKMKTVKQDFLNFIGNIRNEKR